MELLSLAPYCKTLLDLVMNKCLLFCSHLFSISHFLSPIFNFFPFSISNLRSPISNLQSPISNLQSPISYLPYSISHIPFCISYHPSSIFHLSFPISHFLYPSHPYSHWLPFPLTSPLLCVDNTQLLIKLLSFLIVKQSLLGQEVVRWLVTGAIGILTGLVRVANP